MGKNSKKTKAEASKEILERLFYALKTESHLENKNNNLLKEIYENFEELDYSILLEKLLDFWDIPTMKRKQIRLEIRNSFHNMELAFKWEKENLDFIEKRIQTILAEKKNLEEQKKL